MIERKYVKVYFRIFPVENMDWNYVKILDDHKTVYIRCLQELGEKAKKGVPNFWTFCSERVFYNNTQQEIYDLVMDNVLEKVREGKDAIIMAYGQTGSGKSSTIGGLNFGFPDRGILPRFMRNLLIWRSGTETGDIKIRIQVSYVEISRTNINDLLRKYPNAIASIKDILKLKIKDEGEGLKILFTGEGRKQCTADSVHRSHIFTSIFTFYVNTKNVQTLKTEQSRVHIIDMAGSDTIGNLTCLFKEPLEVGSANLAKTQLEQFFLTLCANIPERYKICKQRLNFMIQFLGNSLCNSTVLRFIGHIRTTREDLQITISMLRFGQLLTGLKHGKFQEISVGDEPKCNPSEFKAIKSELDRLKRDSLYNSLLLNQGLDKMIFEERANHIDRALQEFFTDKINSVALLNLVDIHKALEVAKMVYKATAEKMMEPSRDSRAQKSPSMAVRKSTTKSFATSLSFTVESLQKATSSSNVLKEPKEQFEEAVSATKLKASSAGLVNNNKRTSSSMSASKRRSSSASIHSEKRTSLKEAKSKSSEYCNIVPEFAPEYKEAWDRYVSERKDEYETLMRSYKENEGEIQRAYKSYVGELEKLRSGRKKVDDRKHQLLLAQMTNEYQQTASDSVNINMINAVNLCQDSLESLERCLLTMQENVLKIQAELRVHIGLGREIKTTLKENFDNFCKEFYSVPVENLKQEEDVLHVHQVMVEDFHDRSSAVYGTSVSNFEQEIGWYEKFKKLIPMEEKRTALCKAKKREWTFH